MIPLPQDFDLNEWAVIGFFLFSAFIAWRLPKRFRLSLIIPLLLFCLATARTFDRMLAGPFLHDLYDIMDWNKLDAGDLMTYVMFAPAGYLFVYLYDRWEVKGLAVPAYILCWSLLSTGIEWLLHLAGVFEYKAWKIEHSFAVYICVQPLTLWLFHVLKPEKRVSSSTS
ncbi:hypothetical protein EV586_11423 [Tumebacillus sp. BK434]|uniref:hypothetical protein n=1 Tax=Tumebacillus sp. BK434 TaxID=2512169 RepID=UPI00104DF6C9|nr:hypothetical protein [Tumebacillus sp. BK434]TCP52172.1 hypothetical protein EV586_11423 [Tumebacillus sp. BK434]